MAEAAGWIVAALVVVIAILVRRISKAHTEAAKTFDSLAGGQGRETVQKAAQADLDALNEQLKGQDPVTSITEASNVARRGR